MIDNLSPTDDALAEALGGLAEPVPDGVDDAVFDRWVRAASPVGPVLVAFGAQGVRFLRAVTALDATPERAFRAAYADRFERPLRPGRAAPAGLADALGSEEGSGAAAPPLDLRGLSAFERDVLAATATIPAGQTRSYGWVAREVGRPRAVRAAGSALARNPVPLLVPCHRVVRADGTPGRYIFGAGTKAALLDRERRPEGTR